MVRQVLDIRGLLLAVFLLMVGNGFLPTLLALRMEAAGAAAPIVGLMTTAYFLGLTFGSLRIEPLVRRVGHIRVFAAVVSVLSANTLIYAIGAHPALWSVLRLVDGVCVASVFICIESWLNQRSSETTRGSMLAAYMIALYAGQALGQFLLQLDDGTMIPFVVSSILVSFSALPVLLIRIDAPMTEDPVPISFRALYKASPLGSVGVTVTGVVLGAFYGLGALYARQSGFATVDVSLFISAVIAGGVALQWPLGWLSDRFDRRLVILCVMAGIVISSAVIAITGSGIAVFVIGALFGGLAFSLYPLCVAHTNDRLHAHERLSASCVLVLLYSAGAAAGPLLGSVAMAAAGAAGLFLFTAIISALGLAFGLYRYVRSDSVPEEDQQPWQPLPRTTPMSSSLEPASDS